MTRIIKLLIFSILFSSCAFSKKKTLEYYYEVQENAPYDAIIVPGVPHDGVSWSSTMKHRVLWSNFLYTNGLTKNIIYSGGAVYSPYYEAKIMAQYGKALDIPESSIFEDTLAEHSAENVYYSYLIAKEKGFSKIALATDPFQAKQLKGMISKLELPIDLLPIVIEKVDTASIHEPKIFPEIAKKKNFVSIKERESFLTRVKGTMGRQIYFYEEDLPNERVIKKFRRRGKLIESEEPASREH